MVVPHKLALELHESDVLTVEFASDVRRPVLAQSSKRLGEVGFHVGESTQGQVTRASRSKKSHGPADTVPMAQREEWKRLLLLGFDFLLDGLGGLLLAFGRFRRGGLRGLG